VVKIGKRRGADHGESFYVNRRRGEKENVGALDFGKNVEKKNGSARGRKRIDPYQQADKLGGVADEQNYKQAKKGVLGLAKRNSEGV